MQIFAVSNLVNTCWLMHHDAGARHGISLALGSSSLQTQTLFLTEIVLSYTVYHIRHKHALQQSLAYCSNTHVTSWQRVPVSDIS